uniref:Gustatory receptor n=1 Tax=Anopheles culicifacies TaxID=139723 RepID=A0A182LW52_9DIPT
MYYGVGYGSQWHYFWTHNVYPYTISHFRHVYHLLHILLMEANLRQLQKKLGNLQQCGETERIEECRAIYGELWQINEGINELFGFSQALNVACSFAQIAFDIYWIYAMWIAELEHIELQMYCLIPTPVIIGFLMNAAQNYLQTMDAIEATLLDMNCGEDLRMNQLRFIFLTQLRRNRIRLTAKNIFDFDLTLIRKTYLPCIPTGSIQPVPPPHHHRRDKTLHSMEVKCENGWLSTSPCLFLFPLFPLRPYPGYASAPLETRRSSSRFFAMVRLATLKQLKKKAGSSLQMHTRLSHGRIECKPADAILTAGKLQSAR